AAFRKTSLKTTEAPVASSSSAATIYTLLFNKEYDPTVLGSKIGCHSGVHTVVFRPEEALEVEEGDVIGVYIESGASLVWSFDDRLSYSMMSKKSGTLPPEYTIYDNYITSNSLKVILI